MQQMPPMGSGTRRTSQRSQRSQPARKAGGRKKRASIVMMLAVFAAVAALIVLVSPKEPISHASYTIGTSDGHVETGDLTNAYQGLMISEIMPANSAAVPDENGSYPDWVEVWNSRDTAINIGGVGLSDRSDAIRFLFPSMVLQPGERAVVFCDDTNAATVGEPFHAKFKLSSVGETVYLYDPNAYLLDSVTYPIMSSNESWALGEEGFAATKEYSPGFENSTAGYQDYQSATMVKDGALVISEVMADPITGLTDEDGELSDWIELYNTTDQAISLDNYALSNKEGKPLKWRFPKGAVVAAHGYYVVYCSGKDRADSASSVPHASFRISAEHDTILLSDSRGRLVDKVVIDNLPEDCSYARESDGSFSVHTMATPGLSNSETGAARMDEYLRSVNPIGVYITEVMASNESTQVFSSVDCCDWVEIYNSTQSVVDLSGYGLSDRLTRGRKWQFPQGTIISPGEYKVILCDGKSDQTTTGQLHTSFKVLRAGGETLCLATPDGRVIDKVVLPEIPTNVSYGRTIGLSGFFYYDAPTPMAANGTGFKGYAQAPTFTTAPGLYYTTVYTGFNVPEGTTVYYTTDGSTPTQASTPYNGETLELNNTATVLRARAFSDSGLQPSTVLTGSFFVNAYHSLPIVSLVSDPDNLWNAETGMLTVGDNVIKTDANGKPKIPFKNTVYREVKEKLPAKEGHVEYYLLDGTQVLDQGMEFSLQGQYSLDLPQKSMKLRAKSLYGAKTFQAQLFADRPYTEYKSFVLRNSGNDGVWTRLLDGFQSRMLDAFGTQIIHQAWNPVVVYINGVYWGHMNMRERVDRFFVAQHEGLSLDEADNMIIVEASGAYKYGDNSVYKNMIKKIKASDPAKNEEDLQYILDNVDVDNYFEYLALEMFVGNSDIGNLRAYRIDGEGNKWKWIFYDADYGMFSSRFNSPASYTKAKGMGDQLIDNTIFLKLLEVPEYKDKFLTKLGQVFQCFTTERMLEILEPLVAQIEPEMQMHFARWAEEHDQMVVTEWPTTVDGAIRYWQQRVSRLRNTIKGRPYYLWGFVQEAFSLSDAEMVQYLGERPVLPDDFIK